MSDELEWNETILKEDLSPYDIVVVFNLAEKLLPKKRRLLDKMLNKLPSRVIYPKP